MEDNNIFEEKPSAPSPDGKKPLDTASLVLGIVAILAAAFIPLISYFCGVIGLVLAIRRKGEKRTTAALILCIIGLVLGLASNIYAAQHLMQVAGSMS